MTSVEKQVPPTVNGSRQLSSDPAQCEDLSELLAQLAKVRVKATEPDQLLNDKDCLPTSTSASPSAAASTSSTAPAAPVAVTVVPLRTDPESLNLYPDSPTAKNMLAAYRYFHQSVKLLYAGDIGGALREAADGFLRDEKMLLLDNSRTPNAMNLRFLDKLNAEATRTRKADPSQLDARLVLAMISSYNQQSPASPSELMAHLTAIIRDVQRGIRARSTSAAAAATAAAAAASSPGTATTKQSVGADPPDGSVGLDWVDRYRGWLPRLYDLRAAIKLFTSDVDGANEDIHKCLTLAPDDLGGLYQRATCLTHMAHVKKAPEDKERLRRHAMFALQTFLTKSPPCNPRVPYALHHAAMLAMMLGDLTVMERLYNEGLRAEAQRLPCVAPVDLNAKTLVALALKSKSIPDTPPAASLPTLPTSAAPRPCAQCHKDSGSGKEWPLCAGCHRVRYCSKDCQRAHWKSHKAACSGSK